MRRAGTGPAPTRLAERWSAITTSRAAVRRRHHGTPRTVRGAARSRIWSARAATDTSTASRIDVRKDHARPKGARGPGPHRTMSLRPWTPRYRCKETLREVARSLLRARNLIPGAWPRDVVTSDPRSGDTFRSGRAAGGKGSRYPERGT